MSVSCFVYYRVSAGSTTQASVAVRNAIAQIQVLTSVRARLMTKTSDPLVWMEVYEGIKNQPAFLSAMRECVEAANLERWLDGDRQRHVEIFQCA